MKNIRIQLTILTLLSLTLGLVADIPKAHAVTPWPDRNARYLISVHKTSGLEMTDEFWAHLHSTASDAQAVGLQVDIIDDTCALPIGVDADHIERGRVLCPGPLHGGRTRSFPELA